MFLVEKTFGEIKRKESRKLIQTKILEANVKEVAKYDSETCRKAEFYLLNV